VSCAPGCVAFVNRAFDGDGGESAAVQACRGRPKQKALGGQPAYSWGPPEAAVVIGCPRPQPPLPPARTSPSLHACPRPTQRHRLPSQDQVSSRSIVAPLTGCPKELLLRATLGGSAEPGPAPTVIQYPAHRARRAGHYPPYPHLHQSLLIATAAALWPPSAVVAGKLLAAWGAPIRPIQSTRRPSNYIIAHSEARSVSLASTGRYSYGRPWTSRCQRAEWTSRPPRTLPDEASWRTPCFPHLATMRAAPV
jgi:hypothetical protein